MNTSKRKLLWKERKDNDGKIEAIYYSTQSIVNNMDITERINPPGLKLANDILIGKQSKKGQVKVHPVSKRLPRQPIHWRRHIIQ